MNDHSEGSQSMRSIWHEHLAPSDASWTLSSQLLEQRSISWDYPAVGCLPRKYHRRGCRFPGFHQRQCWSFWQSASPWFRWLPWCCYLHEKEHLGILLYNTHRHFFAQNQLSALSKSKSQSQVLIRSLEARNESHSFKMKIWTPLLGNNRTSNPYATHRIMGHVPMVNFRSHHPWAYGEIPLRPFWKPAFCHWMENRNCLIWLPKHFRLWHRCYLIRYKHCRECKGRMRGVNSMI